ncbi:hypothetical protein [Streptomyces globosus]|uniref:hypothetical protein n=1 Tax=Streptomyces globosus TaxID=68209 RepID=UPI0036424913
MDASRQKADRNRRAAFATARKHGLNARHQAKLARASTPEQYGARIALATLRRDRLGVAAILDALDATTARQAASVALAALAELALTARPANVTRTRDYLTHLQTPPVPPWGEGGEGGELPDPSP